MKYKTLNLTYVQGYWRFSENVLRLRWSKSISLVLNMKIQTVVKNSHILSTEKKLNICFIERKDGSVKTDVNARKEETSTRGFWSSLLILSHVSNPIKSGSITKQSVSPAAGSDTQAITSFCRFLHTIVRRALNTCDLASPGNPGARGWSHASPVVGGGENLLREIFRERTNLREITGLS